MQGLRLVDNAPLMHNVARVDAKPDARMRWEVVIVVDEEVGDERPKFRVGK